MNNDQWTNVFGEPAAVGLDSTAEPMSVSHNAQSDGQHMHVAAEHAYVDATAPAEHAYVPAEPSAERTNPEPEHAYFDGPALKRTTIYLDGQHLAQLAAVDDMPAAWHVRRAIAAYVERMTKPTVAHKPEPMSVRLSPTAHALAVQVADRLKADVGTLVSAAVMEQLEVMR